MPLSREARPGQKIRFILAYLGANLSMELEYRASFFVQFLSMGINNVMWLVFWVLYFDRFPVVRGWERLDILCLWAIVGSGYGLAHGILGNVNNVARIIYRGELDVYLVQPKPVLLHVLVSRTRVTAWADVLFGVAVFAAFGQPSPARWLLYVVGSVLTASLFGSFLLLVQSLAFFLGNAEALSDQLHNAMIHFSTYPSAIFEGPVKFMLFSVLPAGFINYLPVGLLREFSWSYFLATVTVASAFIVASSRVFGAGLRRYESGNLVITRL